MSEAQPHEPSAAKEPHPGGPPDTGQPHEEVRARRVEIVDAAGRVRVVLGEVDRPAHQAPSFGLVLFDEHGRRRVWAAVEETGPVLVFDHGGNIGIEVGIHDATPDSLHTGAYIMLNDGDGRPVLGWQVEADGSLTSLTDDDPTPEHPVDE